MSRAAKRRPLNQAQLKELRRSEPSSAGNRLAKATDLAGVRRGEVAESVGFAQSYFSDVIGGRYPDILLSNAMKLSRFFGCTVEDLFPNLKAAA